MSAAFRSEELGSFSVSPEGQFEIATFQTFVMTVRVGSLGMDDRGSVRFVFHGAKDYSEPQTSDASAPGYVTARTSSGRPLKVVWSPFLSQRPWFNTLEVSLVGGGLKPDDTITIVLGDRSGGSPGFRLQTYCQDRFKFRALINPFSTQQFFEMAEIPTIEIGPGLGHHWVAILPTLRQCGDTFRLSVKCEDIWGNPSDRLDEVLYLRPSRPVAGLPETLQLKPGEFAAIADGLSLETEGDLAIDICDQDGRLLCTSSPLRVVANTDVRHYWGDLHGQTEETIGTNSAWRYFEFARDKAFLDIASHQGNDFQISDAFWTELNAITAEFDETDRFLAVPGYEWSGNSEVGGDRNVWFRREGRPIRRAHRALVLESAAEGTDCGTARALFDALIENGEDVAMAAHCGGRYADIVYAHDGRVENAVEIHSAWGTFEWILRDAFEQGYRIGIVGNSDGHKGRPGASYPGDSFFTSMGGLTCFQLPSLSRDHLFEAMRRRHHYATTGARLFLSVRAEFENEATVYHRDPAVFGPDSDCDQARAASMGDIVRLDPNEGSVRLCVDVGGSQPIERIEIFDGPTLLEAIRPNAPTISGKRVRVLWQGARYRGRGRNLDWSGEVVVEGNQIESFEAINFWSPDNQPSLAVADRIAFSGVTAGNMQGFDLTLKSPGSGRIRFLSDHGEASAQIDTLVDGECVQPFGGLDTRVVISAIEEAASVAKVTFDRTLSINEDGDTRLYVRVTQTDGHQAWSSPIYLFRGES